MNSELLNVTKLAKYLGVTPGYIYQYKKILKIPFFKIGNRVRFVQKDIDEWIKKRKKQTQN